MRKNRKNVIFESVHVGAYKMVVNFDESDPKKDTNLYMIDTGMNGHPLQGHYFDMNKDHIEGRLLTMKIGQDLEGTPTKVLTLKPGKRLPNWKRKNTTKSADNAAKNKSNAKTVGQEEEL